MLVDPNQIMGRIQIALVDAQVYGHILIPRDGRHPVNEEGLRHGVDIGGKHHQCVHVGHRRADKVVLPGQDFFHHALSLLHGDLHQIAGEGGIGLFSQNAPGTAGNQPLGGLHIVKSA